MRSHEIYTLMAESTLSAFAMVLLLIITLFPVLFFFILINSGRRRRRGNRYNLPPSGTRPLPIIGHLHLLTWNKSKLPIHQALADISDRYGPVLLLRFGSRPVLIVSSPSAAEECFTKNDVAFANRPHGLLAWEHLSYNYTSLASAPYGALWRDLRRFATVELFSSARTSALSSLRAGEVGHLLRKLFTAASSPPEDRAGYRRVNMQVEFSELTMNMMTQTIAGKRFWIAPESNSQFISRRLQDQELQVVAEYGSLLRYNEESGIEGEMGRHNFRRIITETFHMLGKSNPEDFVPLLKWLGTSSVKKNLVRLDREVDELLQHIVNDQRQHLKKAKELGDEKKKPILDILLSLQETDPVYYTDFLIKGLLLVIIFGGSDTSAVTMEWALALLMNHPEIQAKVRAEIDAHVGHERILVESDLDNLPYLHNVIKETLRLFPAGPLLLPHETTTDCSVAGYDIPGGTMLLVNAYGIHRDPKYWENPLVFNPERFAGDDQEGKGFNYIPFGFGRRRCPGELMATRFVALALGVMIQCFVWERVGEEEVDLTEGEGLSLPRAVPLEAMYKPRKVMNHNFQRLYV